MASAPGFRPDVEGLRGLAILLVVLFHAGVSQLAGGFVGVDVFFVLSGYFITGLLLREATPSGDLGLSAFYGRRALRLLPPLVIVLIVTLAAVMFLYAPIDRAPVAATARSVALSSSNLEFASDAVNYFSSGENPLLHTWSLAVEEQFYLVWPLLFLLFAAVGRRLTASRGDVTAWSSTLLPAIAVVGALSFALSLRITSTSQPWAFFGMPTRIWEFAIGGALAVAFQNRTDRMPGAGGALALQIAGLAAIVIGAISYDGVTPYPGVAALLPAFGAVALLAAGDRAADTGIGKALAAPSLRWLGRMSYAWYLWHWPLVGIGAVLDRDIGLIGRLGWSAIALVLAYLTYIAIEQPVRQGKLLRIQPHRLSLTALTACGVSALLSHGAMVVARNEVRQPGQRVFADARRDRMNHGCWVNTVDQPVGPCAFGDTRSSTTVVLLGDSHAEHWLGGLDRVGRERGWKVVAMVKGGCPVADLSGNSSRDARYHRECDRYREAMVQRIISMRPAAVILSSWDHYVPVKGGANRWQVTPEAWRNGLRKTYARLSGAGIPTVAVRGTPRAWFDVPACLSRKAAKLPFAQSCDYEREGSLSAVAREAQTDAARGLKIGFVDMNDQICSAEMCGVERNGAIVFTDDNHLTASFTRSLAPVLGARMHAALSGVGASLP
jgi:peptidoglycan/LPS O-acetylase OafA/YrhL